MVAWFTDMLETLTNGNGARYLSGGGDFGADVQTTEMKEQCKHTCGGTRVLPPATPVSF